MAELISREGNKVQFRVTVPVAEVNRAYEQVWAGLSRDVRVPGFRPGKAPRKVLENRVGKGYVEQEVRDRLLQAHYPQAARELGLSLVDAQINPGTLTSGQGFDFTVNGETYPEVTLGDWRAVQLTATAPDITDEVLERTLADLQERNATFQAAERPIEGGDQVTIEELGEEGGSYPVYLDVAEPHVRDALVGKTVGDEVEITVPAHTHGDHEHPEHTVRVRVQGVQTKQLQALDDEFAKSLNFDTLERLRGDLRAELQRRAAQEGDAARREEFVTALVNGMAADVPGALIDRRKEAMLEEIQDDLGRQGVKWDEYETFMREQGKLDEFLGDLAKNAESRVKRDLALEKLAEDLGVRVSQAEFDASISALAQANNINVQQLRSQLGPNGLNNYLISLTREKGLQQALAQVGGQVQQAAQPGQAQSEEGVTATEAQTAPEQPAGEAGPEQETDVQASEAPESADAAQVDGEASNDQTASEPVADGQSSVDLNPVAVPENGPEGEQGSAEGTAQTDEQAGEKSAQ